jgi:hypothetical protein
MNLYADRGGGVLPAEPFDRQAGEERRELGAVPALGGGQLIPEADSGMPIPAPVTVAPGGCPGNARQVRPPLPDSSTRRRHGRAGN